MQGRLLPPVDRRIQAFPGERWPEEFPLAKQAGVEGIEVIYESHADDENPLSSNAGTKRLRGLSARDAIAVQSVCADWFMERPLLAREQPARDLEWLAQRAAAAGITRVVLPLVDRSSLGGARAADALASLLDVLAPVLLELGVELHLETDLEPERFARLLERLEYPSVGANYDTGNSASLGYDPREEFEAFGRRIASVHVKDRLRGGDTVPLGEGDADLELVLGLLRGLDWQRPVVLQTARGRSGEEVARVRADAQLVRSLWDRAASLSWT